MPLIVADSPEVGAAAPHRVTRGSMATPIVVATAPFRAWDRGWRDADRGGRVLVSRHSRYDADGRRMVVALIAVETSWTFRGRGTSTCR